MSTLGGNKRRKIQPGTSVSIKMYSTGNIECLSEHPSDPDVFDQLCVQQKGDEMTFSGLYFLIPKPCV